MTIVDFALPLADINPPDMIANRMMSRHGRRCLFLLCVGLLSGCAHFHPRPLSPGTTAATFGDRSLADAGLHTFLAANHVTAPPPGGSWSLKALTLVAFYYQPTLAEARTQLLAAQAAQITAGQRPNPSISVLPSHDAGVPGATSPWIVPITMDWPIETAGRRGYRIAQARELAGAARWNLIGTVWRVRTRTRAALLNLYIARRLDSLLAREVQTRGKVVRLFEGQFAAGSVSSYIVEQARTALNTTILAQQAASGQVRQARVQLAVALGLPLRALRGLKSSFAKFNAFPLQLTKPQIRRQALLNRADVRAALDKYAASQSALQLQIARQYPNIHLGLGYTRNAQLVGDREWNLGLISLTLPILNQNQGPIAEARARRKLAAARFLSIQATALGKIDSALAAYHTERERVGTATSLLNSLQKQLASIRAQVQVGELQPLDLANARVAFDVGAQNRIQALLQAQQALGQLEQAVQSPLTLTPSALRGAKRDVSRSTKGK